MLENLSLQKTTVPNKKMTAYSVIEQANRVGFSVSRRLGITISMLGQRDMADFHYYSSDQGTTLSNLSILHNYQTPDFTLKRH